MTPNSSAEDSSASELLLLRDLGNSVSSFLIVVRDSISGEVVCRVACQPPSSPTSPLTYDSSFESSSFESTPTRPLPLDPSTQEASGGGKSAAEVMEAVRDLTGCSSCVLMDGPKVGESTVFTRSDRMSPGTYYLHRPVSSKPEQPAPSYSLFARFAAVTVALVTLGLIMQSAVFLLALPHCGWNRRCILGWYKSFISHIDGPFKMFAFVAAIQRAAANPSIWLSGFEQVHRAFGGKPHIDSKKSSVSVDAMQKTVVNKPEKKKLNGKKD